MASQSKRPAKRRVEGGGRVTPKGGADASSSTTSATASDSSKTSASSGAPRGTAARSAARSKRTTPSPDASSRYTPPVPSYQKASGPIVPILMFTFWGLGIAMIIANYLTFLPGGVSNWYVFGGLGLILAGIVTATQYR